MPEEKGQEHKVEQKKAQEPQNEFNYTEPLVLLSWRAPGRPYKRHSKEYYINILLIMAAIEVIVFLFHMDMLMLVILTLGFLAISLALVPPHLFNYKITSEGVRIEDYSYIWDELYDFYFEKHNGIEVVKIGTKGYIPGELMLILGGDVTAQQIKEVLIGFLPFREYVEPTFTQKAGDWLGKNFPLEKTA